MKPSPQSLRVAVVGATGAVGKAMLPLLAQRQFPVSELIPFASARSEGKSVDLGGRSFPCRVLKSGCFDGVDLVFLDASDEVSKEWVPEAIRAGAWVVDNSGAHRMGQAPLIVPEVNGPELIKRLESRGGKFGPEDRLIAGPNCSTVQLVVALKPLSDRWGLKRVVVSSYQSTSGAGSAASDELLAQTQSYLLRGEIRPQAFTHQIAFNCIPHIGSFQPDGYTSEEKKIMAETRKIMSLPDLRITATTVRVPTLRAHAETVNVELQRPFDLTELRDVLRAQSGVQVIDEPAQSRYPLGLTHAGDSVPGATASDPVYVGRIRRDETLENGVHLWVVADNLLKGAALNAVQIGELILPFLGSRR